MQVWLIFLRNKVKFLKKLKIDDDINKMYKEIEKGKLLLPSYLSNEAKDLLKVLIIVLKFKNDKY